MINSKTLVIAAVLLVILGASSVFRIQETETALKLQLGKVQRADYEPGLHWKFPLVEEVLKFDKRVQTLDSASELYLTNEKKNVVVDSFVKWRISDPQRFYTSAGGSASRANDRLSVVVQKRLKDEIGKRTLQQVVSGERGAIMDTLQTTARDQATDLGIEIIDVRIKRVDLPEKVSQSVYDRMSSERAQVAKLFRSEGEERARQIRAEAEREREVILAEAERDAEKLRGEGDGKSTEIYAAAYGEDAEFYSFYRSLQAYRKTFSNGSDVLLLDPNSQFFRFFKDSTPPPRTR
ncbi:MAG: membrane protease subunit HflC [Gammaproteobacteria bacterium]|jgi:membrane protease subunit HflC